MLTVEDYRAGPGVVSWITWRPHFQHVGLEGRTQVFSVLDYKGLQVLSVVDYIGDPGDQGGELQGELQCSAWLITGGTQVFILVDYRR